MNYKQLQLPNASKLKNIFTHMVSRSKYFELENKRLIILPLQIIAAIVVIAGSFALLFEVTYFAEFSFGIYFGRLIATAIGFIILVLANFEFGRNNPTLLIHVLLLTIIASFASIIIQIPDSIYINSHLLALVIFTSALFLNWDLKNQIIVAIYYNILFASSILISDRTIYFLPSMYASFLYVVVISLLSIIASSINYKLRQKSIEKTFESLEFFENANEGLFKIDFSDSKIKTVNPSFRNLFEIDSENRIEETEFKNLFQDVNDYYNLISEFNDNFQVRNFSAKFTKRDGNEFIGLLSVRISESMTDNRKFIEGSIKDITTEKIAEENIKKYNDELRLLNNSKDKFFSILAHDLISPFSAVLGYSEILAEEYKSLKEDQVEQFAKDINSVTQKAYNLLSELLDWSRIQTGRMPFEPENIYLRSIVNDIVLLYTESAKKKSIRLTNEISKDHMVLCDFKMLNTTFRNLISNALKFTYENGEIKISSELKFNMIEISVTDNGVGISEEDQQKLFKIDIHHSQIGTGKEKGSGLGLILCEEFIRKNNGNIWVESEIGKGSSFKFTLPIGKA